MSDLIVLAQGGGGNTSAVAQTRTAKQTSRSERGPQVRRGVPRGPGSRARRRRATSPPARSAWPGRSRRRGRRRRRRRRTRRRSRGPQRHRLAVRRTHGMSVHQSRFVLTDRQNPGIYTCSHLPPHTSSAQDPSGAGGAGAGRARGAGSRRGGAAGRDTRAVHDLRRVRRLRPGEGRGGRRGRGGRGRDAHPSCVPRQAGPGSRSGWPPRRPGGRGRPRCGGSAWSVVHLRLDLCTSCEYGRQKCVRGCSSMWEASKSVFGTVPEQSVLRGLLWPDPAWWSRSSRRRATARGPHRPHPPRQLCSGHQLTRGPRLRYPLLRSEGS